MKIKLTVEYHGEEFKGWQFQPGRRTVEQELGKALNIYLASLAKKIQIVLPNPIGLTANGRTDSGVHANGQVVNFTWPEQLVFDSGKLLEALNGITPRDIGIVSADAVSDKFNARIAAHTKCYRYYLMQRRPRSPMFGDRVWHIYLPLNVGPMIEAAKLFRGTHNFQTFQAVDCHAKTTVRTVIDSQLVRVDSEFLIFTIQGKGFLKNMVRKIVGTLVEVGRDKISVEEVREMIEYPDRDKCGPTAPARGLFLEWVRYHENFEIK